jgi:protein disulfide-isomerase A1
MDFDGGRTASEIVAWLKKKSGDAVAILNEQNITSFIDSSDVVLVAYFENPESESAKIYNQLALALHESPFGIVTDKSLIDLKDSGVVLFKKFDEKKAVLNAEFTEEQFRLFVKEKSVPLLNYFFGSPKIFDSEVRSHLFYFGNKDDENNAATEAFLREAAQLFRGRLIFSFVDVQSPLTQRVCEFFQVSKENAPGLYAFNLTEEGLSKYRPDTLPTEIEGLKAFLSDFFAGTLTPFLKSAEPVPYEGKGVRVLVGKDHDSVVSDSSRVVFVEYYAPWCGHCKSLAPIWEELAQHFDGNDQVTIAKFDATANEVQSVNIQGFPTLYLFNKDNQMIAFQGGRTLEELIKFVQSVLDGTYVPVEDNEDYGEGEEEYVDPDSVIADDEEFQDEDEQDTDDEPADEDDSHEDDSHDDDEDSHEDL